MSDELTPQDQVAKVGEILGRVLALPKSPGRPTLDDIERRAEEIRAAEEEADPSLRNLPDPPAPVQDTLERVLDQLREACELIEELLRPVAEPTAQEGEPPF